MKNLSGIYYRSQDPITDKWVNVCYEELPISQQEAILATEDHEYAKRLALKLSGVIKELGGFFEEPE